MQRSDLRIDRRIDQGSEQIPGRSAAPSSEALGRALLARARNAVALELGGVRVAEPYHADVELYGATFVTLFTAGALHGCVGSLEATRSLADDVQANAIGAAFRDPRFTRLTLSEFTSTRFEVSLLGSSTPIFAISESDAVSQLVPHRDGVTLRCRDRRATLLPQVWAHLPGKRDFLRALKTKAGLSAEFWSADVYLERYSVMHFDESADPIA